MSTEADDWANERQSNTPRTDAAIISAWEWGEGGIERSIGFTTVPVEFARTLEKENAALREQLKSKEMVLGGIRAWLTDKRMETWMYIENGGFDDDLRKWVSAIDTAKEEGK